MAIANNKLEEAKAIEKFAFERELSFVDPSQALKSKEAELDARSKVVDNKEKEINALQATLAGEKARLETVEKGLEGAKKELNAKAEEVKYLELRLRKAAKEKGIQDKIAEMEK